MENNTINKSQAAVLRALARISIDEALGGENTVSYELLAPICAVEMRFDLSEVFLVSRIEDISADDYDDAIEFFISWEPSYIVCDLSDELEEDFTNFRYRYVEELPQDSPAYKQLKEDYINALCSDAERLD